MSSEINPEFLTALQQSSIASKEMFDSLTLAGFTEDQALKMIAYVIKAASDDGSGE